ncbi:PspA/IM30 family protein [Cytobacillus sp. NCCP-133]|uniref:PspA/IM30 family protein n=1 Tax=Cytobacillus sp. NCCP-133 TaxID=766848 RepID=UPI002231B651|nr:PspA/IM30 family protein [Cytobacillus sp. NCCP-133]GLB59990.1 phage shock protein A [Cytobacillus sp. NCCP-133]
MANLLTRIKDTVMADLHEALDKKEKKNPIALLNQYLRECERETEKVRKLLERQNTLKEEFTREYEQAKELSGKRKRQAEIASQAGEEELYQFAAQEQLQYEERANRLESLLTQSIQQMGDLERKYEEMKHKLKDMHIRRMELMGRENITHANHQMEKVLENNSDKSFSRFREIESYLDRLDHQVKSSYHSSTIDARIAQLEKELEKKTV